MSLTEACIRRPVLAWMIIAATVVFGGVAATRIGISQFPDVDYPTISVSVTWEGATPEVVEQDVVEPLEEALVQVEGVRTISSSSRQGLAQISVEMDLARDIDLAMQDVQARVAETQRRLPRDVDPPVVGKTNPEDQPIMWIGLAGPYSPQLLADTARYVLKEKLQTVPGVGEVTLGGSLERSVRLWVDAAALDRRGVTVSDVVGALQREHVELPAGRLEAVGREVSVRVLGEALDLATLRRLVVAERNGQPVYLEDVALVEDGFEDIRRRSRVMGMPAQGLGVRKQRGANAVAVGAGVKNLLAEIGPTLPEGMEVGINFDSTQFIEESVREVEWELLLAVLLTAFVCWLFLGSISSTINVVLAIPMSLFGTIAVIYFLGYTLNTFTLLALSLSVGIVVDDAIMVLENIFRHAESGKDRERAAREGTSEITFAALAATVAIVAIFVPVIFMEGVIGKFFLQFGVTLSVAVLLSYVEAVTLAPARCAQLLSTSREARSRIGLWFDARLDELAESYGRALDKSLRRPVWVLGGAGVLMVVAVLVLWTLPSEFVPSQEQSRLMVRLTTPLGSDLDETDRVIKQAEAFVQGRPEIARVFVVVGSFQGGAVNSGMMFLTLKPPADRKLSQAEFMQVLRKELNSQPGVRAVVLDLSQQGFSASRGFPIEFSVQGPDWERLGALSQDIMDELRTAGLATDLDSNWDIGMPELQVVPDRARAADLGVSTNVIAETISALVGGLRVGKYSSDGRRVDVRLRLLANQRGRPEDIDRLQVRTRDGDLVPLSTLVRHEERAAFQAITRRDRERAVTVTANVATGQSQNAVLAEVERLAKDLPPGYRLVLGGMSTTFRESMGGLLFALMLGILVAYMVLGAQFNSFAHPLTVLTILPLSVAGASLALLVTGQSLNMFSMIGLLLLLGIVKKNSIILVDYAAQAQREGLDARAAVRRAGPARLRPILMTSVATMMAAVPAALSLGSGAEVRTPMAIAVIGGLFVSTGLSLFVVPAFYVAIDAGRDAWGRFWSRRRPGRAAAQPSGGSSG